MQNNVRLTGLFSIIGYVILAVGVAAGSFYLLNEFYKNTGIESYIAERINTMKNGCDKVGVMRNALKNNCISFAVIFASGFFKGGFLLSAAEILRRGFISGFTFSAYLKVFGLKGTLPALATMPGLILLLPAAVVFSAFSASNALGEKEKSKEFIIFYIIFLVSVLSIFCMSALLEGYLTTICMKWAAAAMGQH